MLLNEKSERVIEIAKSQMGYPYVFGAVGEDCTPKLRGRRQSASYPTIKSKCQVLNGSASSCTGCIWEGARMFDCRGFTYWVLHQVGIVISTVGATTQYNRTQDWLLQGEITNMPDVVCCVFKHKNGKMTHTGLHIGGGNIIHCSGCVKTGKTTDSGWTHFAVPKGLYTMQELSQAGEVIVHMILKNGSRGAAVQSLQEMLNQLGFSCGKADGIFGAKTEAAVRAFQSAVGLLVDGIAGEQTQAVLAAKAAVPSQTPPEGSPVVPDTSDEEIPSQITAPIQTPSGRVLVSLDAETANQLFMALKNALLIEN